MAALDGRLQLHSRQDRPWLLGVMGEEMVVISNCPAWFLQHSALMPHMVFDSQSLVCCEHQVTCIRVAARRCTSWFVFGLARRRHSCMTGFVRIVRHQLSMTVEAKAAWPRWD